MSRVKVWETPTSFRGSIIGAIGDGDASDSRQITIASHPISMFRLLVFDLDGTLVDSRRDIAESANAVLEACGAAPLPEETVGRMVGDGAATLVARGVRRGWRRAGPDALDRFLPIYDGGSSSIRVRTRDCLTCLAAQRPGVRLAVLTNKPLAATRSILAGLDLARFFDEAAVVGGDGPLPRKPDPAGLQRLAAEAGVGSAEVLMVGDSDIDARTAYAASASSCLVRWGFGFEGLRLRISRGSPSSSIGPPI